ncbi:helix-turn-helix domain-containing protein [Streptomyces canus]|uniref:helix-turn-helix domain-containing protein n=1 Tax=Streptomyces canus TaxID=58343 RepID=UPI0033C34E4C
MSRFPAEHHFAGYVGGTALLHWAFAAVEESVSGYIRRSRLQWACTAPSGRPSVSELAAQWQFADSSHFIRAFKKEYGQTSAQFARSSNRTQ